MNSPPQNAPFPAADMKRLDDERLFELLDRYVAALHAGDVERCALWLAEFPELREMARCLEALDCFAPAVRCPGPTPSPSVSPTVIAGGPFSESDAAELSPGATGNFGKFELLEEIGRGGMGVVYKARQRDLDRLVALKMILANRLAAAEDVKRFYREARAAGGLRHPQIVGIHEVGQVHGQHYFAMDFIAGRSLAEVVRSGAVDPERAARWLAGVARAV